MKSRTHLRLVRTNECNRPEDTAQPREVALSLAYYVLLFVFPPAFKLVAHDPSAGPNVEIRHFVLCFALWAIALSLLKSYLERRLLK